MDVIGRGLHCRLERVGMDHGLLVWAVKIGFTIRVHILLSQQRDAYLMNASHCCMLRACEASFPSDLRSGHLQLVYGYPSVDTGALAKSASEIVAYRPRVT
jgi:hypothetical protein